MSWKTQIETTDVAEQEQTERAKSQESETAFRRLARDLVDSPNNVDHERIEKTLRDSGRNTEQLKATCMAYEKRKRLWAKCDREHELKMELVDAQLGHVGIAVQFSIEREQFERQCDALRLRELDHQAHVIGTLDTLRSLGELVPAEIAEQMHEMLCRVSKCRDELQRNLMLIAESEAHLVRFRFFEDALKSRKDYFALASEAQGRQGIIDEQSKLTKRLRAELAKAVAAKNEFAREAFAP